MGGRGSVAFDGKNLWVGDAGLTVKVDAATGAIIFSNVISGPSSINGIAFDGQFIWIVSQSENLIRKWNIATNEVIATVATYPDPRNVAFDGTYIWVTCNSSDTILRIDVRTNQIIDTIQQPVGSGTYDVAFDGTHMWVNTAYTNKIYKYPVRFN